MASLLRMLGKAYRRASPQQTPLFVDCELEYDDANEDEIQESPPPAPLTPFPDFAFPATCPAPAVAQRTEQATQTEPPRIGSVFDRMVGEQHSVLLGTVAMLIVTLLGYFIGRSRRCVRFDN